MGSQGRTRTIILFLSCCLTFPVWGASLEQQAFEAYQNKQYSQAMALYRQLIAEDPLEVQHYFNLGVVSHHAGQYQQAIQAYQQAMAGSVIVASYEIIWVRAR